jgi:NADPH:quinone reductase-like Zn-dependent oxidoreductase
VVGLDVSGTVDAVGDGVSDVGVGDRVLGVADYAGRPSAGASDYAILNHWTPAPKGLDLVEAAALPMVVETAFRSLEWLGVGAEQTLLVNGAGTMVGFAAVQIALMRGARVIATAGETFAERLRALGATATAYGDGMVERVREIASAPPDLIFDAAPVSGVLPDLVRIAGGDPRRVLTCTDLATAAELGVRNGLGEEGVGEGGAILRYDVLGDFAQLAAEGRFTVPIARTFALEDWRQALDISQSGHAQGKLLLLPAVAVAKP